MNGININEFMKEKSPGQYYNKLAESISKQAKEIQLPDLEKHKNDFRSILGLQEDIKFGDDLYGLAVKFEFLRRCFIKLYTKKRNSIPELQKVLDYLLIFKDYFSLVSIYIISKPNVDYTLRNLTEKLKLDIEMFTYSYDFVISDISEALTSIMNDFAD